MIGVKWPVPSPPKLVMVKLAPRISSSASFASRAFPASAANSTATASRLLRSTSRTTGTTKPRSVSTATPRW